jgi:transcriptional regulator with XRE-family HTH domain
MVHFRSMKLRRLRELRNYSQAYVAGKLHISQSYYSKLESGRVKIRVEMMRQIASVYEVDPEIIIFFDEPDLIQSIGTLVERLSILEERVTIIEQNLKI